MWYSKTMPEPEPRYSVQERVLASLVLAGLVFAGYIMLDIALGGRLSGSAEEAE
jgi:hypothetical protein